MATYPKATPGDLDFGIDYADWLAGEDGLGTDTLIASTWEVPTGITLGTGAFAPSFTDTDTKVWLVDGTAGEKYVVINDIETADGRDDRRYLTISVVEAR